VSQIRTWVSEITLAKFIRCIGFLLFHLALCMVFSIAISWLEMRVYLDSKGPNFVNEFVGMYLVVGFIFGQFSCILAFPVHLFAYFKVPTKTAHWIAVTTSILASLGVWFFFYMLAH